MPQNNIDWSCFRKRILIDAKPQQVYHAWAVPDQITTWFLEKAEYISPEGTPGPPDQPVNKGDSFSWKWHNWDFQEEGSILEANGKDRISFTFGAGGVVHIHIQNMNQHSEIVLLQEEIPTDEASKHQIFVGCSTGWTFWLANLKAWLEHGITLHATGLSQSETDDLVNS